MTDPQTSLDQIRRMQERTREEYVRHGFGFPQVLMSAVGLFVVVAARDLPDPWAAVVSLGAVLALVVMAVVHTRRAAVRRQPSGTELALLAGASVALLVGIVGLPLATAALDLPAPNTIAGAVLALMSVVIARATRSAFATVVGRQA
jgi:hypothetical protein